MTVLEGGPAQGTYPSPEEVFTADPVLPWIDSQFLRPDPFAFRDVGFRPFVSAVVQEFDIDPNGVFCVGSGATGLSLNPGKMINGALGRYNETSDLDVALISEVHFETAWRDLRRAVQPTVTIADDELKQNLQWQKKRFFDGAIIANKMLPSLSFGPRWLASDVRLSERVAVLLDREVELNYWIFRDYWSLRNYVAASIVGCRKKALA